jgi:hypothetical protein
MSDNGQPRLTAAKAAAFKEDSVFSVSVTIGMGG